MTGLKFGTRNVVIVNDAGLVHDLLVKRSAAVNARPEVYMAQKHVLPDLWKPYSLLSPPRESKMLRTMGKEYITGAGLLKLSPMQKAAGARLLDSLAKAGPNEWFQQVLDWYVEINPSPERLACLTRAFVIQVLVYAYLVHGRSYTI
jgi:hypothetical protein